MRRWVEEVEIDEVIHSHAFQHEDDTGNVTPLYLGYGRFLQFLLVTPEGIETETLTRGHSARSSSSLIG